MATEKCAGIVARSIYAPDMDEADIRQTACCVKTASSLTASSERWQRLSKCSHIYADVTRHLTVRIPEDLKTKWERKNQEYGLGYSSFPEFIKDCMRRRFEEIESSQKKPQSPTRRG